MKKEKVIILIMVLIIALITAVLVIFQVKASQRKNNIIYEKN